MIKKIISSIFLIIFITYMGIPSIVSLLDNSVDTSTFHISAEDDEKSGENNVNSLDIFSQIEERKTPSLLFPKKNNITYLANYYLHPNLNLAFPPPKFERI